MGLSIREGREGEIRFSLFVFSLLFELDPSLFLEEFLFCSLVYGWLCVSKGFCWDRPLPGEKNRG